MNVGGLERHFLEVDDLLLRLKGLVLVHALLEERGANPVDLRAHGDEIQRLRSQLAGLVRDGAAG